MDKEDCSLRRGIVGGRTLVARKEEPDGRWFCRLAGYIAMGHESSEEALDKAASFLMRHVDLEDIEEPSTS